MGYVVEYWNKGMGRWMPFSGPYAVEAQAQERIENVDLYYATEFRVIPMTQSVWEW